MQSANATELKNNLGEFLEKARTEPVAVKKTGRNLWVLLSREEYDRLTALEEAYWGERAKEAAKKKSLGPKAAMKFLEKLTVEKLGHALP